MNRLLSLIGCVVVVVTMALLPSTLANAAIPTSDFSLEVSPSPLVATVTPGTSSRLTLKVRNASLQTEQLKIQARGFSIAHPSEQITITTTTPPDLAEWVHFSHPTFAVKAGEWFTQDVTINLPESAGFSYPFALVISRLDDPAQTIGGASIRGSIAVFTLVNIDKPGASRQLELESFTADRTIYEYVPTTFTIRLKNTGNSITQPYGNIYVQRPGDEGSPLAVLAVNEARSYILPGGTKEMVASWSDGFPRYSESRAANGAARELQWNWNDVANFRFGRYTARMVAVYNDGIRDVPITGEVSFWVIPWRILLGLLVILVIIGFGIWSIIRRLTHHTSRIFRRRS